MNAAFSPTKTAVILCNLGTPDAPTPAAVRRYLKEFLWDRRVVEIPRAYELIIRALKQGQGKGYKAMPVLQAMQRRYPDHPSTQEAAWVMRDEVNAPAA